MISGVVTIVGRPNVGKSTLFNRLTGTRNAIVDDRAGITRDRIYGVVRDDNDEDSFLLVDTGGFETKGAMYQPFRENLVWKQTQAAISESDVVILMFDGKNGVHPHDRDLVNYLKKENKEVIYVVNKLDHPEHKDRALEFYELGISEYLVISASHGMGVGDLVELIEEKLKTLTQERNQTLQKFLNKYQPDSDTSKITRIALVGRPNVGKSSILNRIIGEERSIVSDVAGTTRDPIDSYFAYNGKPYLIVDTAGIRRKSKINEKIESLTVMKSLQAIENADVVVLVISATEPLSDQDARLASVAIDQYKPLLILVNKWDLVEDKDSTSADKFRQDIYDSIQDKKYVPIHFISCLTNQRVFKTMGIIESLVEQYEKRVSTSSLNELLKRIVQEHTPALIRARTKRVKFYFATQVRTAPPTIVIKCNFADELQESYKRYVKNRIQEESGFTNIPVRIIFRAKADEFEEV